MEHRWRRAAFGPPDNSEFGPAVDYGAEFIECSSSLHLQRIFTGKFVLSWTDGLRQRTMRAL